MASWFIWGLFRECARALSDTTNLLVLLLALSTRPRRLPWVMLFGIAFCRTSGARTSFPLGMGEQQYTTKTSRQLRSQTPWAPGSPFTSTGNKDYSRAVFSASTPVPRKLITSSPMHALVLRSSRDSLVSGGASPGCADHVGTLPQTRHLVPGLTAAGYASPSPSPTAPLFPATSSSPTLSSSTTSQTTSRTEAPLASSRQKGCAPDGNGGSSDVVPSRGLRCFIPQTLMYRVSF